MLVTNKIGLSTVITCGKYHLQAATLIHKFDAVALIVFLNALAVDKLQHL